SRPCRSRPVKTVSVPGCGAVGAAVLIELLGSRVRKGGRVRRGIASGGRGTTVGIDRMTLSNACTGCTISLSADSVICRTYDVGVTDETNPNDQAPGLRERMTRHTRIDLLREHTTQHHA